MRANIDRAPGVRLVTDYPGAAAPAVAAEENELLDVPTFIVLRERENAGVRVELCLSRTPIEGVVFLRVTEGLEEPCTVGVPPAEANEAFEHPYCYLPR